MDSGARWRRMCVAFILGMLVQSAPVFGRAQDEGVSLDGLDAALAEYRAVVSEAVEAQKQLQDHLESPDFQQAARQDDGFDEAVKRAGLDLAMAEMKGTRAVSEQNAEMLSQALQLAATARDTYRRLDEKWEAVQAEREAALRRLILLAEQSRALLDRSDDGSLDERQLADQSASVRALLNDLAVVNDRVGIDRLTEMALSLEAGNIELDAALQAEEQAEATQVATNALPPTVAAVSARPDESPSASPPVSAKLLAAVEVFFAGKYEDVADLLEVESIEATRQRALAHLLIAASKYRLSRAVGPSGTALLEDAKQNIRSAVALSEDVTPRKAYFSPGFRQLFSQVVLASEG